METFLKAQKDGKIRYIGFSAHSEEAAHAATGSLRIRLDPVPAELPSLDQGQVRAVRLQASEEAGMGILALKAMNHGKWPKDRKESERPWEKAWYEPFDEIDKAASGTALHVAPARDGSDLARSLGVIPGWR